MGKRQRVLTTVIGSIFVMLTAFSWVSTASADLPPRPTAPPPEAVVSDFTGGVIVLSASVMETSNASYWTTVEWQDSLGAWHQVDGWRGEFGSDGRVVWWVAPENLGETDFRWVVYENEASTDVVFVSIPFDLPSDNGITIIVEAELD